MLLVTQSNQTRPPKTQEFKTGIYNSDQNEYYTSETNQITTQSDRLQAKDERAHHPDSRTCTGNRDTPKALRERRVGGETEGKPPPRKRFPLPLQNKIASISDLSDQSRSPPSIFHAEKNKIKQEIQKLYTTNWMYSK